MTCQNCSILWEEHRKTFFYLPTTQLVFCAIWDHSDIALVIPYKLALIIPHSTDLTLLLHMYHKKDKHSGILLCSTSVIHVSPYCMLLLTVPWFKCFFSSLLRGTGAKSLRRSVFSTQHVNSWKQMLWPQSSKALGQMCGAERTGSPCLGLPLPSHLNRFSKALIEYSYQQQTTHMLDVSGVFVL